MVMLGTLPVALTAARCSREARLVSAVLFWMMRGPPIASSMGRLSLVSLGFWLICKATRRRRQCQARQNVCRSIFVGFWLICKAIRWRCQCQAKQKVCRGIFLGTIVVSAGNITL